MSTNGVKQKQRTLAGEATISGAGLFSGAPVTATMKPSDDSTGVRFRRVDLPGAPEVPAHVDFVVDRPRRTALQSGEAVVETVEHCMSALAGLGIDNAVVDLDATELPGGDGSARLFVDAIESVGAVEQESFRRPIVVTEPITVGDEGATVAVLPNDAPATDYVYDLDYGMSSSLGRQACAFTLEASAYRDRIASARTYATAEEAKALQDRGMCTHLTPKDILVIGDDGPIENSFRFADEPARHKLLDLVGDIALTGRPLRGRVVATRSGHSLNHRMARELVKLGNAQDSPDGGALAPAMDTRRILRLLPHRYPMVLVDRVVSMDGDLKAVGIKNVTMNEPFFQGHYPESPIMPGVLIVEAMSQLAGLMLSQKLERTGKIAVLLGLENVKLRKPVTPGDQLVMETQAIRATSRFGEVDCRAFVGGKLVAEAQVKFMMVDAEQD